jgi:PIN domain nuclease of toxin-antitoxin system
LNLLLDTHALLWFLTGSNSLSIRANQFIEDGDNAVWVSPASFWEIGIKMSLGKYELGEPLAGFMQREITQNAFAVLPISWGHADRVSRLPFHHRDSFDRLMVAQALEEDLTLVSADSALDACGVRRLW